MEASGQSRHGPTRTLQLDENDASGARGWPIDGPKHAVGSQGYGGGANIGAIVGRNRGVAAVAGSGGPSGFGIRALQWSPRLGGDDRAPQTHDG